MTTGATTAPYRNPKGHVLGAPWTFVLPDAAPHRVVVLGRPSAAAREALARFAPLEVRAVGDTADLADGSAGVVAVLGRRAAGRLRRRPGLHAEAVRLLRPGGALYVDGAAPRGAAGTVLPLAVTPVVGEPRTVAPAGDEAVRRQLARRGLSSPVVEPERLEAAARRLARGRLARLGWRRATLVTSDGVDPGAPPAWLLAMAGAEGVDLEGMRWALSAAGRYRSRKVLVFLFDPGADAPRFVVKLPRHPEEGGRLEREAAALAAVAGAGLPDAVDVPRLAFSGVVGRERLPVLGQVALPGAPLRSRLAGGPDDPVRTTLLQWVTELGTATAAPAAPGEVTARLEPLLERFLRTGRPSDEERSVLRDAVAALAAAPGLPLVLEHGDLGVWNVLVRLDGKPAVLDWEAAERRGMPLWDLLYLLRSFAASTSGGGSDRTRAVVDLLEGRPPLGDVLTEVVGRYASALRLDPAVLVPLLLTCWMHRAQKEASRREDGPYRRLLRHCVEHRHSLRVGAVTDGLWRSA